MQHNQGRHTPLDLHARVTHHNHDPESYLGILLLGRSLDGLEATKGQGQDEMGPYGSYQGYRATRPSHPVFESFALKSPGLTPSGGGILPSDRCGGGRGPTGLTTDDLWDISQRGTAELHID
jgi:hypothetical protein